MIHPRLAGFVRNEVGGARTLLADIPGATAPPEPPEPPPSTDPQTDPPPTDPPPRPPQTDPPSGGGSDPVDPVDPVDPPPPSRPPPPPPGGSAFEGLPFAVGGAYAWLPDSYDIPGVFKGSITDGLDPIDALGIAPINSNRSGSRDPIPDVSGSRSLCISAFSTQMNQHGPLWWLRRYNAEGSVRDVVVWRAGDFVKGREGHVLYLNVLGDLSIEDVTAVQCGAQVIQLVWRPKETGLPQSAWGKPGGTVSIKNLVAIDPGVINTGAAVRASHPVSFFNPGHDALDVDGYKLRCNHAKPFQLKPNGEFYHSHGALLTGPGFGRCGLVELRNLDLVCVRPDRPMIRANAVDNFRIVSGMMHVPQGINQIDVWNTCKRFEIMPEFDWTGTIKKTIMSQAPDGSLSFKTEFQQHKSGSHTVITQ